MSPLPIVLTGTVVPNAVGGASLDPARRRAEYLDAINFYSRHSEAIYFLENSIYDVENDPAFTSHPKLRLRKLPLSADAARGKGYQEFEMLDAWVASEKPLPTRWLKVSGRYVVRNIAAILGECADERGCQMIIDQAGRSKIARTQLFCVESRFYIRSLAGIYRQANDDSGEWIERVLFSALAKMSAESIRFFKSKPNLAASSGATGKDYPSGRLNNFAKQLLRDANRHVDQRYLWFSR